MGESIWDWLLDPLNDEYTNAGNAQPPRDPLAIDLGALGIELTTLENGVNFDLDKNGFAEKTAWIGLEDGFLMIQYGMICEFGLMQIIMVYLIQEN